LFELNLIPTALNSIEFFALITLSFFTSFLTATIGIGGGTLLIAVMAQLVPVKAIIPVHGVVQLGSNFGRALVMLKHVQRSHVLWFFLGCIVGALIGGRIAVTLPVSYLKLALGCFILYSIWGPKFSDYSRSIKSLSVSGGLSSLLTMFVGATGPFVIASLRPFGFKAIELVATTAACLVIQHTLKVITFGILGFAFSEYLGMIILMISTGFLGTLVGRTFLLKVNEVYFKRVLNIVLTILAIRLLYSGCKLLLG
jgi:uncharacterized membrane protein YfcA